MEGSFNPEVPTAKPPETVTKHIEAERRPLHGNVLLIFGQGPTIDPVTRARPSESGTIQGQETVNLWLEASAQSVGALVKRNVVNEVVILGGRTGGKERIEFVHLGLPKVRKWLLEPGALPPQHAAKVKAIFEKVDALRESGREVIDIKDVNDTTGVAPNMQVTLGGGARNMCVEGRKTVLEVFGANVVIDDSLTWEGY